MSGINRVDPAGCGCIDCITGWSKPVDALTDDEWRQLIVGDIDDVTGLQWAELVELGLSAIGRVLKKARQ